MELTTYPAVIKKTSHGYTIHFPDLPDADVVDEDLDRARLRATIGLAIIISDLQSHRKPVPAPSDQREISEQYRDFHVELITTDLDKY
ncbi:type II toxin-antitoxin system HicB family antitoxin [Limosilactobacillus fermentum]|uniref:type II toxin-antitoxin system HicB family antitoxin n=1 Tax=Limosilactobacillus fermentum TaxID=1613 RepID=UPI00062DA887|nr:type II toxin-antitoxin system HicB family antitoxin [Limosilactobacillus fermentum]AZI18825.1 HicB family protein [Limosilactobacillus fermentum]KLD55475.1 hypothetical protein WU69_03685 [Limosilactobacillus fermentum]MCD5424433.1 type II toxin-antitoxin system HicB family antitoxin [Limosilactobacillus fermentum]MCT3430943.1 HicB family protein [Limosilactobacillus fermentum]MCT3442084.1 HicB family protein [Limosilactobacillus fermentum]